MLMFFSSDLFFFCLFVFFPNSRFHAVKSTTRVCFLAMFVRTFTICIPATKLAWHSTACYQKVCGTLTVPSVDTTRGTSASLLVQKLQSPDVLHNKYLQKWADYNINGGGKHIMHPNLKRFYGFLQGLKPKSILPNIDMDMHTSLHSCLDGPPQLQEGNSSPEIFKPYAQCCQSGRTRGGRSDSPLVLLSKMGIWSSTAWGVITVKLQQNLPECARARLFSPPFCWMEWSALILNSAVCSLCHIMLNTFT